MLSILELRRLRRRIRHTLNITGDGRFISERPGSWWAANMRERTVEWSPVWPFRPHGPIDGEAILYLVCHEASHIKWSGGYTTARIPSELQQRFHRFYNAVEDVRVDRLSARQYGGFREAKLHCDRQIRQSWGQTEPAGWSLTDAVGLNAVYGFDNGEPPLGTPQAVEASTRLWPRLDRIANSRSSQQVAAALEPIFLELVRIEAQLRNPPPPASPQPASGEESTESTESTTAAGGERGSSRPTSAQPEREDGAGGEEAGTEDAQDQDEEEAAEDGGDGGGGDQQGEQGEQGDEQRSGHTADDAADDPLAGLDALDADAGADEPTDAPVKSGDVPGTAPLALGEELAGMAKDAVDEESRRRLREQANERQEHRAAGANARTRLEGGRTTPTSRGQDRYQRDLQTQRQNIAVLANRLRTVLTHNALENPRRGQRRGRFDAGRSYRTMLGDPRIFRRPGTVGGLDYAFGLLLDVSGSMFNSGEIRAASQAMVLIGEALERAGLDVFLIQWASQVGHVKPVGEPLAQHRGSLGEGFAGGGPAGNGTHEALALARALEELERLPNAERLLIVVTDGDTIKRDESVQLLAEIEQLGVQAVTIRIGGQPASHYRNGYRVAHAAELVQLLPRLINDVVRRRAAA